jgi:hypothetical protein
MPIQDELKLFVEEFKRTNGRIPTQTEIFKGLKEKGIGRSVNTIKSYLTEGVDYSKPLTNLEAAKLGGPKIKGPEKVNKKLIKELKNLTVKGVYPYVANYGSGTKGFRIQFDKKLGLKEIGGPATKETLEKLKTTVSELIESDNYTKNILPFQTSAETKANRKFKRTEYNKKDPKGIFKKLQDYKREKYPNLSFDENIQHGQSKFSTQTLSRFGLLPRKDNVEGPIKRVERIRDNNLRILLSTLNNPNASVSAKKEAAEKYNSLVKGLRGQLKGTNVQGFVNFETFEVDEKGNFKKIKDIGFDSKKGMSFKNILGDKPLDKITDADADEILKIGKKHIDLQLLPKTVSGLTTASKIDRPEKALLKEDFKAFSSRIKNYDNLDPTTYPSKTYVRDELKKVPVNAPVNQTIKDFDIPKGTILKGLAKGTLRAVAPFVPFVGALGVALGVSDVAKAKDEGLEGEELGVAYLVGPELAKKYSDFKDRNLNVETESEGIMGL